MPGVPELSVVLPVRNQADHIGLIVQRYHREFHSQLLTFELVLVVNACIDNSLEVCRGLQAEDYRVRVLENRPGGWGLSVRTGLSEVRGRFVCYTNSARTDPGIIPGMLAILRQRLSPAVVKAIRYRRGAFLREVGSLLYNLECRLLFGLSCRDVNGTPKLFPRDLLQRVHLTEDGDLLDLEFVAQCTRLGVPIVEVPVFGWRRYGGRSTTSLRSALKMYSGVLRLWWGSDH